MSDFPSSDTVNELCPGPYCEVAAFDVNTGDALFVQDAGAVRSAVADAVSSPRQ